ncbi:nitrate reductase associated protein [Synechococcus sp. GreenBA-s]|nr:nitrate reductase associated protein [Synechococcus sp. GreenBA-s]
MVPAEASIRPRGPVLDGGNGDRSRAGDRAALPSDWCQHPVTPPLGSSHASTCFAFEADFTADLRCIPMAVRRKLDLAGVKLKLQHWSELGAQERAELLAWPDDAGAIEALRAHLLARSAALGPGRAKELPRPLDEPWQQGERLPELVAASCRQLGLAVGGAGWAGLDELQRFALVKLSHPGHEHRNLPRALAEFGLLGQGPGEAAAAAP